MGTQKVVDRNSDGSIFFEGNYSGCVGGTRFDSLDHFDSTINESDAVDFTLANAALIAARVKMKKADINLGVAWAERNRTAQLLGDTATRIARSFNNLKRGRVRAAMRELGIANSRREPRGSNVPRKWLELQYGWKPLVSDVYGACNALSRQDRSDWRVTAKAQKNRNYELRKQFLASYERSDCVAKVENGAFARIDALPSNDLTMSLASLGISNPLLIAWELVPYSFVVDWAFPVGAWLESLDAMLGYGASSTSVTTFARVEWLENGFNSIDPSTGVIYTNNWSGSKKMVRVIRAVSDNVPLPTFPSIKDPRSLGHMANGLALLASAFSRR